MIPELIAVENVDFVWPYVEDRLLAAVKKLRYMESDVPTLRALLKEGKAQLWLTQDGQMLGITRIVSISNSKRLKIDLIEGSNYKKYAAYLEYVESWAIAHGATQAEVDVRPGFQKFLKASGWSHKRLSMFKPLRKGIH